MRQGRGLPFCAPGKKSHFRPFSDCIKSGNYTTSSSINERRRGGGGHYDYFPFLRSAFALLSIYVRYFVYCSVLNNRPLLISIRGDIQAIKTQLLAGQYPCSLSKLIKNGNEDIKPKFELPRTKTVDLRQH